MQVHATYACWVDAGWAPDNWRVDHARSGGGAVIDLAPHVVDLVATVLGRPWDELDVRLQRAVHGYGVDDGGVVVGRLGETLAVAQVAYCWPEALPRRRLEVVGTAGALTATDTMGQVPGGELVLADAGGGPLRKRSPSTAPATRSRPRWRGCTPCWPAGLPPTPPAISTTTGCCSTPSTPGGRRATDPLRL